MALMERIATLLRANVNELIERAEDPAKMLKQLLLDMENQLLQLKTQVAMALADQHLLEKKVREAETAAAEWHRKAELAVNKGDDALARAALERALAQGRMLEAYRAQIADQAAESVALRDTYNRLQSRLAETQARSDALLAQLRRTQMMARATEARTALEGGSGGLQPERAMARVQGQIDEAQAQNKAGAALLDAGAATLEERFRALEQEDHVERLLAELKSKQHRLLAAE